MNQTFGDLQVRILDNASGNETEDVVHELMRLDGRVQYHRHPTNIGGLQNMIFGMERVTTPYFNILCDDDLLMPEFLGAGVNIHEQSDEPAAIVSARVVVATPDGRIDERWTHPARRLRLNAPDGMLTCLNGLSLTGILYRTSTMAEVGPPRTAWWNWTESGWHALAAARYPIEFVPDVGAIMSVHSGNTSKLMDGVEFRVSWFEMIAELKQVASRAQIPTEWWRRHILPLAYSRFFGTVARLCNRDGAKRYRQLEALAIASDLNPLAVRGTLACARAARVLGVGPLLNRLFDSVRGRERSSNGLVPPGSPDNADLRAARAVWVALNKQAGLC